MLRLIPKTTALVVVDVQERLAAAMPEQQMQELARATRILTEAARVLGAPVLATEQYPKGLGATLPEVASLLDASAAKRFEKLEFSACDASGFGAALEAAGVKSAVVVGMETHVCVYQTVRDLVTRGLEVYVPIDGVASRRDDHRAAGLALCERAGAIVTTSESVVFDWLERAGSDEFRKLSQLIR
jgi:nicotinamidase-related amidase